MQGTYRAGAPVPACQAKVPLDLHTMARSIVFRLGQPVTRRPPGERQGKAGTASRDAAPQDPPSQTRGPTTDTTASHTDKRHTHQGPAGGDAGLTTDNPLKDPVCGMTVTATSPHRLEHDFCPFYFCSAGCGRSSRPRLRNALAPTKLQRRRRPKPRARTLPTRARCTRRSARTTRATAPR
jgi:YHS domain-containing protein